MFTYAFWQSEVSTFKNIFEHSHPELVYINALNGIVLLACRLVENDPGHQENVLSQLKFCMDHVRDIKGEEWLLSHVEIAATHGSLPK